MNIPNNEKVISFFREISKIPRETCKEKQISDYLLNFANERKLEVSQDELYNIIIKKKSNIKNYNGPAVILQGHMDMVYVKAADSNHVYENGIEIIEKDGYLYGNKTTLGADNGIAVAYCLAILDSSDIKHPDLEVIITVQEEGGLVGAQLLNTDSIKGKYLINLDAEEEGVVFTSCAGGIRNYVNISTFKENIDCKTLMSINISGLKGGHSGMEIDLERGNAIKLMARLLYNINSDDLYLCSINSIGKANAIPNNAHATIAISNNMVENITDRIKEIENVFKKELFNSDEVNIKIDQIYVESGKINVYSKDTKNKIINILMLMPNGVINKSMSIPGLVQTSINVGSLEEKEDNISILSSIRSSVGSQKYNVADNIKIIAETYSVGCKFFSDYPEWEYKTESKLRELFSEIYMEIFQKKSTFTAIHAGLECGYLDEKLKDVDIISIGPNVYEVHTINEHVSIESIRNVWVVLVKLLERLSEQN